MISATGALWSPLFTVRSLVVLVVLRSAFAPAAKHGGVPRESNLVFFFLFIIICDRSYIRLVFTHECRRIV